MKIQFRQDAGGKWFFYILDDKKNMIRSRAVDSKEVLEEELKDLWQFFKNNFTLPELIGKIERVSK